MRNPRTPEGSIAGALGLLDDNSKTHVAHAGLPFKLTVAAMLDHAANVPPFQGRHSEAELLAHRAQALRAEVGR